LQRNGRVLFVRLFRGRSRPLQVCSFIQYIVKAFKEVLAMYGCFGAYTRWAVVFLIIFVLFILLIPHYPVGGGM
jgi:hypothetical protein